MKRFFPLFVLSLLLPLTAVAQQPPVIVVVQRLYAPTYYPGTSVSPFVRT